MYGMMLAGVSSNVGKTTVTMGVMAAYKAMGQRVVPFKTGPDYIDPMFHTFVTDNPSANLDTWMVDPEMIKTLYYGKLGPEDLGIVEGVMGLYDGHSAGDLRGSSAFLAKTLDIPVFLVIDGRGMSTSAAALVKGYVDFDPDLRIAGVIVNRIASQSHFELLKEAIETHTGVPCVGWLPNNPDLAVGSRHLGLIPADELENLRKIVALAAEETAAHVDLERMLELAGREAPLAGTPDPFAARAGAYAGLRVGYAWDQAFNFYYHDNLNALETLGVELVPFSPLRDGALPDGLDALYLGGGFPEVFGEEFQGNVDFRRSLNRALVMGLPCFAECGGLMVLTRSLAAKDGQEYEGVDFFQAKTVMTRRLQRFGYVTVTADLGDRVVTTRGHEFHHSLVEEANPEHAPLKTCYDVEKRGRHWRCGYTRANTLAGYPHIHFYSNPEFLFALLDKVVQVKAADRG